MAEVQLEKLYKSYRGDSGSETLIVKGIDLTINDHEFMVLVGPSGCGKSTTLRMIAGLEDITGGSISIGGRVVNDVAPKDRDIAMVFQNYALYPHMTVEDNMAFGLKLRKTPKAEIDARVKEVADQLGLQELLKRKPGQLSGGQRQRVALGRAIVRNPQVFLMDEPLSNLDAKLRVQTRAELIKLHRRLNVTTVYVTHDQVEAMTMGQRIAVMKDGLIQQCDTPMQLFRHPVNMFVAGFIGTPSMNFVPAELRSNGSGYTIDAGSFQIAVPQQQNGKLNGWVGKKLVFGVRPGDIYDASLTNAVVSSPENTITTDVDVIEPMGELTAVYLKIGEHQLVASVSSDTIAKERAPLKVSLDLNKTHLFDAETENAIY
jgi:multiple sugar transport system ATP-binding protein